MDEAKYHDILLKEYAEAGSLCRNIEQLTRTSLSLFVPVATALAALVVSRDLGDTVKLALSFAGLIYALLLLNTVYRQRAYYQKYVERAKNIEAVITRDEKPVMSLYTMGAEVKNGTRTFSNKLAIAAAFWVAAVYFSVAAIAYGCAVYRGVAL